MSVTRHGKQCRIEFVYHGVRYQRLLESKELLLDKWPVGRVRPSTVEVRADDDDLDLLIRRHCINQAGMAGPRRLPVLLPRAPHLASGGGSLSAVPEPIPVPGVSDGSCSALTSLRP